MNLREYLFDVDPYEHFPVDDYLFDIEGFNQPESVFALVRRVLPRRVIEVGTWKGRSALRLARILWTHRDEPFELLCIDTWLGSKEMWTRGERELYGRYSGLMIRHGCPRLYDQFVANVIKAGFSRYITPCPMPSTIASRVLAAAGYQADLIYLDASHDEADVRRDLVDFWPLLAPGGYLVGDDFGWGGMAAAVQDFVQDQAVELRVWPDEGWAIPVPEQWTWREKTGARGHTASSPGAGPEHSPAPPTPEL